MNIVVFGTGYVGLVTGACLADSGHNVICVDIDKSRIEKLNNGIIPIYEPGLEQIIKENTECDRLRFTTDPKEAVNFGELQFIAVGTPPDEDGSADLQYVLAVAETIATNMTTPKIIINKSTVPVGTAEKVEQAVSKKMTEKAVQIDFEVCSNPEFLKEGSAIEDFTKGPRIIVGTNSDWVKTKMRECYKPYNRNHDKLMFMDVRSAELTKYAANSILATKISFMNELSNLAELLDADIEDVRLGIGSDPRIGYDFIYPGCGYGGSCFPKDVQALAKTADSVGYNMPLLKAVESVNVRQKMKLFEKTHQALGGELNGKTIGIWGLSFKPNTDDMREAPSRSLMESLWKSGAKVKAYDPEAREETMRIYGDRPDLILVDDRYEAANMADILVICTEWKTFRAVDFDKLQKLLKRPIIVDGRNLFDPKQVNKAGFLYFAIGRGDSLKSNQNLIWPDRQI